MHQVGAEDEPPKNDLP